MNCSVVSDLSEKLTVVWKKNNVDLGQSVYSEDQRISQDENYNLIINNVTLLDEGKIFIFFIVKEVLKCLVLNFRDDIYFY